MRKRGFEPLRFNPLDPKSSASASSATLALSNSKGFPVHLSIVQITGRKSEIVNRKSYNVKSRTNVFFCIFNDIRYLFFDVIGHRFYASPICFCDRTPCDLVYRFAIRVSRFTFLLFRFLLPASISTLTLQLATWTTIIKKAESHSAFFIIRISSYAYGVYALVDVL